MRTQALLCALPILLLLSAACNRTMSRQDLSAEQDSILQRLEANMVLVEGGTFTMGCTEEQGNCEDNEKPAHAVTLSSFRIGKYEVTQEEWELVMGDNPSTFHGPRRPVEDISWEDAQEFIRKLNKLSGKQYRLPTEAEWEYAARGGRLSKGHLFSGGNDLDSVGWYNDNATEQTHKVGQKLPNELGLYDMSGNVWEWCSDWYDGKYYAVSPDNNPQGPDKQGPDARVLRGGSWFINARSCRLLYRSRLWTPGYRSEDCGFRLVSPNL